MNAKASVHQVHISFPARSRKNKDSTVQEKTIRISDIFSARCRPTSYKKNNISPYPLLDFTLGFQRDKARLRKVRPRISERVRGKLRIRFRRFFIIAERFVSTSFGKTRVRYKRKILCVRSFSVFAAASARFPVFSSQTAIL